MLPAHKRITHDAAIPNAQDPTHVAQVMTLLFQDADGWVLAVQMGLALPHAECEEVCVFAWGLGCNRG